MVRRQDKGGDGKRGEWGGGMGEGGKRGKGEDGRQEWEDALCSSDMYFHEHQWCL